jgi:predicted DNA-binding protein (UPF0251 family)
MTAVQKKWLSAESLDLIRIWKADKFTDAQIAMKMGISHSTLCNWKNIFPELVDALVAGKMEIIKEAENALYRAAFGYMTEETRTTGKIMKGVKIPDRYETVSKFVKPDTTALIFLLTNMDRENWKRNNDNVPPEDKPLNKLEIFAQKKHAR